MHRIAVLMSLLMGLSARWADAQDGVLIEPAIVPAVQLPAAYGPIDFNAGDFIKAQAAMRENLNARLIGHLLAYVDWVGEISSLSDQQRQQAQELARSFVEHSPVAYHAYQMTGGSVAATPMFAHGTGIATLVRLHFTEELRQNVLTPEQSGRLDAALRERTASRRRAYRELTIATLDRELYFTSQQRAAVLELLAAASARFDAPPPNTLQGVDCRAYEFPEELREQLSPGQVESWKNSFQSEETSVVVERSGIEQLRVEGRNALLKAGELQIEFYRHEARLGAQQVEALRLAAKRIAVQRADQWLAGMLPGDVGEGPAPPFPGRFELAVPRDAWGPFFINDNGRRSRACFLHEDPAWQEALQQALAGADQNDLNAREQFHRNARTAAVVTMLDEELWLRAGQRPTLQELVARSLPESLESFSVYPSIANAALCAAAIQSSPSAPPAFLNDQQKTVWHLLEKHKPADDGMRIFLLGQPGNLNFQIIEERAVIMPQFAPAAIEPAVEQNAPARSNIEIREEAVPLNLPR